LTSKSLTLRTDQAELTHLNTARPVIRDLSWALCLLGDSGTVAGM